MTSLLYEWRAPHPVKETDNEATETFRSAVYWHFKKRQAELSATPLYRKHNENDAWKKLLKLDQGGTTVAWTIKNKGYSQRRARQLAVMEPQAYRYRPSRTDKAGLRNGNWSTSVGASVSRPHLLLKCEGDYIEAFNGRFWAERLSAHCFLTLADAAEKMEDWHNYNEARQHEAMGYKVPISLLNPVASPARHRKTSRKTPPSGNPKMGSDHNVNRTNL